MKRKGIILAGGSGTRLLPLTAAISKQLLPVYNKPMIYYPVSVFMLANIREILLISTPHDIELFKRLFGDGNSFGLEISYEIQAKPSGIAEALIIGERFLDGSPSALILGDNIFFGKSFSKILEIANTRELGATIFSSIVSNPERYGVAEFDEFGKVLSLEEKPSKPKSQNAVTGLYFYDQHASQYSKNLIPSERGELEITDLNQVYLERGELTAENLGLGFSWFDAGTHESLLEASNFVQSVQKRQRLDIGCLEEIAMNKGWLTKQFIKEKLLKMGKNSYSLYIEEKLIG